MARRSLLLVHLLDQRVGWVGEIESDHLECDMEPLIRNRSWEVSLGRKRGADHPSVR